MINKVLIGITTLFFGAVLVACNGNEENTSDSSVDIENTETSDEETQSNQNSSTEGTDHSDMNQSNSGEIPKNLTVAENPAYSVGSEAVIDANHMKGMEGATATIVGAYDTIVYSVTYTPTTGGELVKEHKWIVHEEIEDPKDEPYGPEDEFVLAANHMEGMKGATATIDSADETTVYMISYTDTETGEEVTNHKWVTGGELTRVE